MMEESPTLPYRLFVIPPVEVAAARLPCMSRATAPTVPIFGILWSSWHCVDSFSFNLRSYFNLRFVLKYAFSTISNPN